MDDQRALLIIADHLHIPLDRVRDEADFVALGADSLDMVSLTMRLEEEFDLHIPDDVVETCMTVGNALAILRECKVSA
ncbi:MAG: acyl carrier protein [Sphingomicrobium sp.]